MDFLKKNYDNMLKLGLIWFLAGIVGYVLTIYSIIPYFPYRIGEGIFGIGVIVLIIGLFGVMNKKRSD